MPDQLTCRRDCARPWFGLLTTIVAWLPLVSSASTYYVATNGADTNSGTLGQPFLTIQKAANVMVAGDTVFIRGGTYRESVTPVNSGTSGAARITYQSYSNEVVTINGADVLASNTWAVYSGNIYSNAMSWDLTSSNQVFLDGQMMIEARYPNTSLDVSHPVKLFSTDGNYTGTTGTLYCASLTQPTNYWVGASIAVALGKVWQVETDPVINSGNGQISFTFTPVVPNYLPTNNNQFFLFGKFSELDSPGEWFRTNNTLYFWPPQSDNPGTHFAEAKRRALGFNLNGKSWITVRGITLFACTITTDRTSKGCLLDALNVYYPSHFTQLEKWRTGVTNAGVIVAGTSNILQNSLVAYSAGSGVVLLGTNNIVTNNLIHDVNYSGNNGAGVSTDVGYNTFGATNSVIANNTIYNCGLRALDICGMLGSYVHHNDVSHCGLQLTDFGPIYAYHTDGQGTRIAYNLVHDTDTASSGLAYANNSKGIYLDGGATDYVVDHNVVWGADRGIILNPSDPPWTNQVVTVVNNTLLGGGNSVGWSYTSMIGTVFQNNIFRSAAATGPGAALTNNLTSGTDPKFVDASNDNYQLQATSPAINTGLPYPPYTDGFAGSNPDKGAYEYGQPAWTAGATVRESPAFLNLAASQATNYGSTNIVLSGKLASPGPLYPTNGETISISINGTAQNTAVTNGIFALNFNLAGTPVSITPYTITYAYSGSATFNAATNSSTTLTVNPAPLTVTASNVAKAYDGIPFIGGGGVSCSGFVNGEDTSVLGGVLSYGGTSQGAVAAGTYSIIPSGLTASNYSLAFSNGTLTITVPAATNLTWDILGGDGAAISNGSGTWDTSNTNWNDGTGNLAWNNSALANATFGKGTNNSAPWVTGPVVTLGTLITVGNLTFTNWNGTTNINYQITGNTLSLSNTPIITTRSDGQITSVLAGSGFVKDGAGILRVDGTSPNYSGNIIVSNGLLQLGNNGAGGNLGLGIITLVDPGAFVVRRQGILTVSNVIAGATSANVGFQLNGSAVVTLASASTYAAAGTYLQPTASGTVGTLKLGTHNALPPATAFSINNNGASVQTFDLAGFNQTLASLATGANASPANSRITNSSGTTSTLTIAGTNATTFAGLLAGNLALAKVGTGTLMLASSNTFTGSTMISGGTLNLSGSISNAAQVIATNTATLQLSGGIITANLVRICTNAFLLGCGRINAVLLNDGTLLSSCGTNLTINGAVTNNGTMRITAGTQLIASGPFVNNGLLDIINAAGSLPPGFVNNGVVLDSSSVVVSQISFSGPDVQVQILSAVGHTYQLQRSGSLAPANWLPVGASQSGTGGVLTFTNSAALAQPQGFYRFQVN